MAKTQLAPDWWQNSNWIIKALTMMFMVPLGGIALIFLPPLASEVWTAANGLVESQDRGSQGARPDAAHEPGKETSYRQFTKPMFDHYPPDLHRPEQ